MKKRIAALSLLWVLIAGVWIAGLNWENWVVGARAERSAAVGDEVVMTLYEPVREANAASEKASSGQPDPGRADPAQTAPADEEGDGGKEAEEAAPLPAEEHAGSASAAGEDEEPVTYVLNTHTKKIHLPDCPSVADIKEKNRGETTDPEAALAEGYAWCGRCHG